MLRTPLLTLVMSLACAFAANSALAQDEPKAPATPYVSKDGYGMELTREQRARAEALAQEITDQSLKALQSPTAKRMEEFNAQAKRRADDIADAAMATERSKVLDFLGIRPEDETALYYFVSYSMPVEMLRSYAIEAMWAGGTLVFRGPRPGRDLQQFITEDMAALVWGKGASASISIDPRLYDVYKIKTVPTIVYSKDRKNFECQGVNPVSFTYNKQNLSYDTCPPLDESKYWKLTGAVTTDYALRAFIDDGAVSAKVNLAALAKGVSGGAADGTPVPKAQQPFTGDWNSALTPADLQAAKAAAETIKSMPKQLDESKGISKLQPTAPTEQSPAAPASNR